MPNLDHQEQSTLDVLVKQWRAKRPRNNLRSAFYDMKNSERSLMADAVPATVRRRRFVLGWSAIAVDKLNRRCNLDGFYSPVGMDLRSMGMDEVSRGNRLPSEISQAGQASLSHAVSFLVATQGDEAAGEAKALLTTKTASSGTGAWDPRSR